jgi:hypothetical protein
LLGFALSMGVFGVMVANAFKEGSQLWRGAREVWSSPTALAGR